MAKREFLTAPIKSTGMPASIPYIIGNEAAERFSFYGMRSILVVFMTKYLMDSSGNSALMTEDQAKEYFHLFVGAVYFLPFFGGILADAFIGKYRTIFWLSLVYCLGQVALAIDSTRWGLAIGLTLIAMGSGGIKPCVSANVGDQFGQSNQHLLPRAFSWFYFSINIGSSFSMLLIPWLLQHYGPRVAFGFPGFFMILATLIFWRGRYQYVHIPPTGMKFFKDSFSLEGLKVIGKLSSLYLFIMVFWSLYDQTSSAWVLQAQKMNLHWLGVDWIPSQVQAINPFLILIFIPVFTYWIYPFIEKFVPLPPPRRIAIGMFITVISFAIPWWIEIQLEHGLKPSIQWHFWAYILMSAAEIMISITALEFSYTQAPKNMKSLIMSTYLMAIALGNWFTFLINRLIQNADGTSKLPGSDYYRFFTVLMLVAAIAYTIISVFYKSKTYIQDEKA